MIGGEIAFVVISYVNPSLITAALSTGWDDSSNTTRTTAQEAFTCCGFYNSSDRAALPCPVNATASGCQAALEAKLAYYSTYVRAAGYTLMAVEVVILGLTLTLACRGMSEEDKRKQQLEEARKMNRDVNDYGASA